MNYRPLRVGKLIREELSKLILKELEFPPGSLATITNVEVNAKLERAVVGLSVIPPSYSEKVLFVAKKATNKLQWMLMKKLNIRPMPKIEFEIDRGTENAAKVERVLLGK
jgi:ribosome-binding factor A